MEIWGHCPTCDRWFYCPTDDGDRHDEHAWLCPVCRSEPTAIENRSSAPDSGQPLGPTTSQPAPREGSTSTG